jgi:F0F1-type ATP synthase membrane subunit b/b'
MAIRTSEEGDLSAVDYLEKALEDLDRARHNAAEELRSMIDSAIGRSREALEHLRTDAEGRAEQIKSGAEDRKARAEDRAAEWQQTLEEASDDVRRDLGIRTVRAQRSEAALKAMSDEIKHHKKELAASH